MQPSEALGVAAQVAITLAGFAGIVVVFRQDSVHQRAVPPPGAFAAAQNGRELTASELAAVAGV